MGEIDKPDKVLNPTSLSSRSESGAAPTLDAGTTPDSSAPAIGSADHGATAPRSIGPYKLIKKLGEGGMGQVWLAQQTAPLERQVALKLIRVGMYDHEVLQRFASERQALASMSHPSIAKVFDAGATLDGQPYFVMEYVPGLPLTDYCDQKRLKIRERLELFIEVCEGVQHAHQKAILHRDLKPANILVAEVDGKAMPRIIDFGLAKAATPQAGGETVFTRAGGWVGTPGYMSPEQADPDVLDVDTRTDVYSLGAVLYVLLTGFLPFETKRKQPFAELLRRLREEDPPLPSTKIDMQKESSNAAAEKRGTESGRLASLLHGDLDWITMKALDKDRARRYSTPSELAADIRRYLRHEPIVARPASTSYRVLKYVRRHRAGVTIAASLLLLLAAFAVTQALQLRRTTRERDRANRVTDFMTGMFKVSDPSEARGNSITAREVLDKAAKDVNVGLTQDPELRAQMMTVMGTIYDNLGLYARAESLLTSAVDIRRRVLGPQNPATLTSMDDLGWVLQEQGRYPEAEKLVREALASRRRVLGPEHPDTLVSMNVLAKILQLEGHSAEAETLNRETLDIRRRVLGPEHPQTLSSANNLAEVLAREGHSPEAEKLCREILDGRRRSLGPEHPDTIAAMNNLAFVLQDQGHYAEAEKLNQETLDIRRRILGPEHPDTLGSMENLAIVLNSEGHSAEAEKLLRETLDIRRRILGPEHPDTAHSSYNLACIVALRGHREEALSLLREAIDHGLAPFVDLGIEKDTDLQSLHGDPRFAVLIGHAKERAAAAQKPN
jgi:serine/threonine protein kinase/Tfp pilus assembly protein PilF